MQISIEAVNTLKVVSNYKLRNTRKIFKDKNMKAYAKKLQKISRLYT